jgi:imidazoleglycerol-phosphate dehydratase/histidinol-phosphatase
MPKRVLFIDRDGTILCEPEDFQVDAFEKLAILPFVVSSLSRIAAELDYELVLVSNQDGLGTDSFPEAAFRPLQDFMIRTLEAEGVHFADVYIDPSFPHENKLTRKPGTAMLGKYIYGDYDLANSFVIGDRDTDVLLAQNLGTQSIQISTQAHEAATWACTDWRLIYQYLKSRPRTAFVQRSTSETRVSVALNLDDPSCVSIDTGIAFFDHMLQQLARHGAIGLQVQVKGDLDVDEHHTIEDTALALGEAFKLALGTKKGIARYGFLLPMDDCLAQVAIDFGGRPWLVWDVAFGREYIGDMPTEMCRHFFKSFCDQAGANLNIQARGENEHHKMESIFKAWAKAIRMAVVQNDQFSIPSTKGSL